MNISHSSCTLLIGWHVIAAYILQVSRTCSCSLNTSVRPIFCKLSAQALTKMKITASNYGVWRYFIYFSDDRCFKIVLHNLRPQRTNSSAELTNNVFMMFFLTVHLSIDLFHLPTLMHNSLFINNMYVTL